MVKEIITWPVFRETLKNQPSARLGEWLARWRFTDEGAILQFEPALPVRALWRSIENTGGELSAHKSKLRQRLY
mgnify:CR=1 FL=1